MLIYSGCTSSEADLALDDLEGDAFDEGDFLLELSLLDGLAFAPPLLVVFPMPVVLPGVPPPDDWDLDRFLGWRVTSPVSGAKWGCVS